jgi:septal ring factor EnvC (AmiA/AmiB activator)
MIRTSALAVTFLISAAGAVLLGVPGVLTAQPVDGLATSQASRVELERTQGEAEAAEARAEKLTEQAKLATQAADRTARETAALAARIQQSEADIAAAEVRLALITDQRRLLDRKLAKRQQPLASLMGALQNMARRPLALSAIRPGSLKETVYARAVLETTLPQIRDRTSSLRSELDRGRALERASVQTLAQLRSSETELENRRAQLTSLALTQRRASREASGIAARENERALLLAEEARDLDSLIGRLDQANGLRRELATLAGPIIRPSRPGASQVVARSGSTPAPRSTLAPTDLQLPAQGRIVAGFGGIDDAGIRSKGISLASRPGAQIVAPGSGRVAFSGPYRGFGRIVIIEHDNGWTSLVTGLGRTTVTAGDALLGGSPLGVAGGNNSVVTFEIRRNGAAVNPLDLIG